ncbi:hypothetical protein [Glutamicibacter halophytocola]|uniref:hypothetical protein n=1 Tax=Glutamicibacter halophytocola TaxID=1933880 RepID=UPI001C12DF1C|nr:hypothetical protein [Glutamicibacter halophytocola]NQD40153.1 hypothetical protein [Glutamicibacter halophytocola]
MGKRARRREVLIVISGLLAAAAAVLSAASGATDQSSHVPTLYVVMLSSIFAVSFGGPFTELVFKLAAKNDSEINQEESDPSPLRGGLWIGLLERAAIVSTLWAGWPEGIAIVLAVKGLGRFSELKDHRAAEQFILGTFSSSLVAAGSYGLGLLLL